MIYKDLFRISIDGKEYFEEREKMIPKYFFTLEELKNIYLDNLGRKFEIEYAPIMMNELLEDSEIYDEGEIEDEY